MVDFLVGFAGFDPMDDDTSYTEPTYRIAITSHRKDWESKLDALDEKMDKEQTSESGISIKLAHCSWKILWVDEAYWISLQVHYDLGITGIKYNLSII